MRFEKGRLLSGAREGIGPQAARRPVTGEVGEQRLAHHALGYRAEPVNRGDQRHHLDGLDVALGIRRGYGDLAAGTAQRGTGSLGTAWRTTTRPVLLSSRTSALTITYAGNKPGSSQASFSITGMTRHLHRILIHHTQHGPSPAARACQITKPHRAK